MTGELDPERFDQEVRSAAEEGLRHSLSEFPGGFHPEEVELGADPPFTRLILRFTLDSHPGIQFGYWKAIWEQVAWTELHMAELGADIRSDANKLANQILTQFGVDLERAEFVDDPRVAMTPGLPILKWKPDLQVHYLRGSLAW
jgi:hypothetical protein